MKLVFIISMFLSLAIQANIQNTIDYDCWLFVKNKQNRETIKNETPKLSLNLGEQVEIGQAFEMTFSLLRLGGTGRKIQLTATNSLGEIELASISPREIHLVIPSKNTEETLRVGCRED